MSRFLLLLIFVAWSFWTTQAPPPHDPHAAGAILAAATHSPHAYRGLILFFAGYTAIILAMGVWSRLAARRVDALDSTRAFKHFHWGMSTARLFILIWFIVGLFSLGWGPWMDHTLDRIGLDPSRAELPGLLLGTLPAFLAWTGLWWSQYPLDVSAREQALLAQLDEGLPVHSPPTLGTYIRLNLRLQLLFTLVPIILLICMHDCLSFLLRHLGLGDIDSDLIELTISLTTAATVFLIAPEFLKRVLDTEPMPDGPLRRRLESICRRHNVNYRDILLWRTSNHMGNAAVMGVVPRFRYILMSDLLLETMPDEQIEAVFAHEIGHVIHRHMLWFAIFFVTVTFAAVCLSAPVSALLDHWAPQATWPAAVIVLIAAGVLLIKFLFLSRKFERQADVFAARSLQAQLESPQLESPPPDRPLLPARSTITTFSPAKAHVGPHGADAFSAALRQVARINNIPVTALSWCHGSIASRIGYLRDLSADSSETENFDRFMSRLYILLTVALFAFGAWAALTLYLSRATM